MYQVNTTLTNSPPRHQHKEPDMKLLAFAATNSSQSINRQLVDYAVDVLRDDIGTDLDADVIDLNDYEMPIYSTDRQNADGIPQLAHDFYNRIGQADALVVSFAEHNGFYTSAYKNLFDWVSRIDSRVYQDTPTVMLATSPGPGGGRNVLEAAVNSAPFFGNEVTAHLSVPSFGQNFDTAEAKLADDDLDSQLREALATLQPAAARRAA